MHSKNKTVRGLLCVVGVFSKYARVKPLKHKKGKTDLNAFTETVNESNSKPNKLRLYQEENLTTIVLKTRMVIQQ